MIRIESYIDNKLNFISNQIGGKIYVYKNSLFVRSFDCVQNTDSIDNIVAKSGDILSIIYFLNGILYSSDNTQLVFKESSNSLAIQRIDILDSFLPVEQAYLEEIRQNIFEKLKSPGNVLHRYLLEESDNTDFDDFWTSIITYLLLFKSATKKIVSGLLFDSEDLISTFLEQRGYILSLNEDSEELLNIRKNLYSEFIKRGTIQIFLEDYLSDIKQGEFFKLINKDVSDEFIFNLYKDSHFGFNIGNSSPLYRGLENQLDVQKVFNNTPNKIVVSSDLDYRVSIRLRGTGSVVIGFQGRDIDDENLLQYTKSAIDGSYTSSFINNLQLTNREVFIEGFIFSFKKEINEKNKLNIGVGNSLIMNENTHFLYPLIGMTEGIEVLEFKVSPVYTPYSRGFVQTNNFISAIFKNNSNRSDREVDEITQRYLLPYHTHWKSSLTNKDFNFEEECSGNQIKNWIKTGNYKCEKVLGVNTGKIFEEEIDINNCTSSGVRWIESLNDDRRCQSCYPNGVDIFIGQVTCDCLSVVVESFGCECINVSIEKIACNC